MMTKSGRESCFQNASRSVGAFRKIGIGASSRFGFACEGGAGPSIGEPTATPAAAIARHPIARKSRSFLNALNLGGRVEEDGLDREKGDPSESASKRVSADP
jgi:hypothetical protein